MTLEESIWYSEFQAVLETVTVPDLKLPIRKAGIHDQLPQTGSEPLNGGSVVRHHYTMSSVSFAEYAE